MRIPVLAILSLCAVAPISVAAAQIPPPGKSLPKAPTLPGLPLDLKSVKAWSLSDVRYERAGLKPRDVRISAQANFSGASWRAFTEGPTTSASVGGRTIITGFTAPPSDYIQTGTSCGTNTVKVRVYLQFRTSDLQGNVFISPVKADSSCQPLPG